MAELKSVTAMERESLGDLRDKTTQVGRDLQDLGTAARDVARTKIDQLRRDAVELEKGFEDQIRTHPLQAVAIAAGAGFLAGFLIGRR